MLTASGVVKLHTGLRRAGSQNLSACSCRPRQSLSCSLPWLTPQTVLARARRHTVLPGNPRSVEINHRYALCAGPQHAGWFGLIFTGGLSATWDPNNLAPAHCLAKNAKHSFLARMRQKPMHPSSSCLSHSAVFPLLPYVPVPIVKLLPHNVFLCTSQWASDPFWQNPVSDCRATPVRFFQ